jgi:hypothetical protein
MAYTKEQIQEMLKTKDKAVIRGILALYERQTRDEQTTKDTKHRNGVGFNSADASLLSSFAEQFKRRGFLSSKQIDWARKKLMKYARQLADIANENEQRKTVSMPKEALEDLRHKQLFAEYEREQEIAAFEAKLQRDRMLNVGSW